MVNSGGTVITSGLVASGSSTVTFSVPWNGNYHIEFYRTATLTGACSFVLDNVVLNYVSSYTQSTSCGTSTADGYPWGHNGQLKDNEIYGKGNAYSAEYWEYDARLIRRWNTDPITYDWQSPYACFNNNPIYFADPLGLEGESGGGGGGRPGGKKNKSKHEDGTQYKEPDGVVYSQDGDVRELKYTRQDYEPECECYLTTRSIHQTEPRMTSWDTFYELEAERAYREGDWVLGFGFQIKGYFGRENLDRSEKITTAIGQTTGRAIAGMYPGTTFYNVGSYHFNDGKDMFNEDRTALGVYSEAVLSVVPLLSSLPPR